MIWILVLPTLIAIAWIFMRSYKRRLDVLTGPWITK